MDTIGARIEWARLNKRPVISQAELARRVGMKQSTLSSLILGKSRNTTFLPQIAQQLGVSVAFLQGLTDNAAAGAVPAPTPESVADQLNSVLVPFYYNVDHSMGGGAYFDEHPAVEMIPFNKSWLRGRCKGSFDELMLLPGRGDSMRPTILDGDVLLVDRAQKTVDEPDRIWAFGHAETGYIKRLKRITGARFNVSSDNKVVDPWDAPISEFSIVGRIISIMQWN